MEVLKAIDVLNFAVFLEDDSHLFYTEMAERFKDDEHVTDLFRFMAEEEFKHKDVFVDLKRIIAPRALDEQYPGEYRKYMEIYMNSHTIGSDEAMKKKIERVVSIGDATDMALEFEKDSIVYYTSLKPLVAQSDHRLVEDVIKEEYSHITRIYEYRRSRMKVL